MPNSINFKKYRLSYVMSNYFEVWIIEIFNCHIRDIDYQYRLTSEKISLQENHIIDLKENKEKIVQQKQGVINENESEMLRLSSGEKELKDTNKKL